MKRREFITLVGGAASWPLAARAQQPTPTVRQARVGVLTASPPTPAMLNAFREGMSERGYIEGQNLSIDVRWPQATFEQNPSVAAELASANVDVIVAWSTPAVIAARRATSTIPIVMVSVGDIAARSCQTGDKPRTNRITCQADGTVCRAGSRHEARRRGV